MRDVTGQIVTVGFNLHLHRMSSTYLWDISKSDDDSKWNLSNESNAFSLNGQKNQNYSLVAISQTTYVSFSVLLTLIFCLGLVQNSMTIYVFLKDKYIQKTHNVFIVALAVSDVTMCMCGVWMVIVASIFQRWIFGHTGCVYYGFSTTTLGLTQIALLATIAVDRYLIIVKPRFFKPIQMRRAVVMVIFCYLFGLFWAMLPALGWSSYQLEGIRLRCAINWRSKNNSDLSYLLSLLICAWLIPLIIILFCYIEICRRIRHEELGPVRKSIRRQQKNQNKFIKSRDKKVAITVLLMIGAFFLSWTPYSVVTFIVLFGNPEDVPVQVSMVPALFAKSSIIWNPIIYVARHKEFRMACIRQFTYLKVFQDDLINSSPEPSVVSKGSQTIAKTETTTLVTFNMNSLVTTTTTATTNVKTCTSVIQGLIQLRQLEGVQPV